MNGRKKSERWNLEVVTRPHLPCCGKHWWSLLEIVEELAESGLEDIVLEEAGLAGKKSGLSIKLRAGSGDGEARTVVEEIMDKLAKALGADSRCFQGNLWLRLSGLGADAEVGQCLRALADLYLVLRAEAHERDELAAQASKA